MGWMEVGIEALSLAGGEYRYVEAIFSKDVEIKRHEVDGESHWLIVKELKTNEEYLERVKTEKCDSSFLYRVDGEESGFDKSEKLPMTMKRHISWPARNAAARKWRIANSVDLNIQNDFDFGI